MKIFITGASGFVGQNLISYFENTFTFNKYQRDDEFNIAEEVVLHLAGKTHDLKNTSSPNDYYQINTELTKKVFDEFLSSNAKVFITLSSVKAVTDSVGGELFEDHFSNPITHYGKSKLLAEQYIFSQEIPVGKRVYILRPCMIHGPGSKGNMNLLFKWISKGIPWPLGAFDNKRSFCSIDNFCFVIKELIEREDIPSGVYNIADDEPVSTIELIQLIACSQNKKPLILNIPKSIIILISKLGDLLHLPLNTERLQKLTGNYIVSNKKIKQAIGKSLPLSSKDGLLKTFNSFNNNA